MGIRRKVKNPAYRVTVKYENKTYSSWIFTHNEEELANAFYKRFKNQDKFTDVKLYKRDWIEINESTTA